MNTIVLMRHGETDANRNTVVQGRMDNPLNEEGRAQARRTGRFLARTGEKFDLVATSPLSRAKETAFLVASEFPLSPEIQVVPELTERHFGDYDGKKIDEEYARLVHSDAIPNMEKNAELEGRVEAALRNLCSEHPGERILAVVHSHVIKSVLVRLLPGFTYTSYLFNCSLNYLAFEDGVFTVLAHNVNPLS